MNHFRKIRKVTMFKRVHYLAWELKKLFKHINCLNKRTSLKMALRQKFILYSSVNTTSCKNPDTRIKLKWKKKNVSGAREFFGLKKMTSTWFPGTQKRTWREDIKSFFQRKEISKKRHNWLTKIIEKYIKFAATNLDPHSYSEIFFFSFVRLKVIK
jgi:hypothetical protein